MWWRIAVVLLAVARNRPRERNAMMNSSAIKEELRNKQRELLAGLTASGFSFVTATVPSLAVLSFMVAAGACFLLGIKDHSAGQKLLGISLCIFAVLLFFLVAGIGLSVSECREGATTDAAMKDCHDLDVSAASHIRRLSGFTLLVLVVSPIFGLISKQRLHTPSTFALQFGEQEPSKVPNRWYSKEKGFEEFVLKELERAGITGRQRYEWICDVRGMEPERLDGGERYDRKASTLLENAPWQSAYDLIERCWPSLGFLHKDHFARRVNEHLREAQVGWIFEHGKWTRVGDEIGTQNLQRASDACEALDADDARRDIRNAWDLCNTLGEGYEKDAVASAMRALERIVQARTNQPNVNLNRVRWEGPDIPHEKLRGVINTLYSYSSDQARHANEGAVITAKEAHFTVNVAAILIMYLAEDNLQESGDQEAARVDAEGESGNTGDIEDEIG